MSELYQLPDGWEWKKLEDLFIVKDGTHDSPKYVQDAGFPLVTSKNLSETGLNLTKISYISKEDYDKINMRSKVDLGDLLFAMIGSIGNPVIIKDEPNFAIKNVALFKCKNETTLIEFLRYYLLSQFVVMKMKQESNGATQKFVGLTYLRNFPVPQIPPVEQKRIVQKLDALFERIDKAIALLQKNIDAADNFMNSVLNDVFSDLERRYVLKSLESVSNIISGYAFQSNDFSITNEIKSIKITNVGVTCFIKNDENKLPVSLLSKLSKFTVKENDIVIALTRPYISNGLKVCFVPNSYDGAFINQRVAAIKSKNEITINKYIYYYLCTSKVLSNVIELSKTLNQPNLSIKDLSEFELPLAPLPIQHKVVTFLDDLTAQIERVKSAQQQKMQNLLDLKSSILDQAFHGKL